MYKIDVNVHRSLVRSLHIIIHNDVFFHYSVMLYPYRVYYENFIHFKPTSASETERFICTIVTIVLFIGYTLHQ